MITKIFTLISGFFGSIWNFFQAVFSVFANFIITLKDMYVTALVPAIAGITAAVGFLLGKSEMVKAGLAEFGLETSQVVTFGNSRGIPTEQIDGITAQGLGVTTDIYNVINIFLPLDVAFAAMVTLSTLWLLSTAIRLVKAFIPTIA